MDAVYGDDPLNADYESSIDRSETINVTGSGSTSRPYIYEVITPDGPIIVSGIKRNIKFNPREDSVLTILLKTYNGDSSNPTVNVPTREEKGAFQHVYLCLYSKVYSKRVK